MEQFNLTPSPALLDLLGKIPFKGWQCVAELIDNSIDAVINNSDKLKDFQKVISVHIPTKKKIAENQPLIIEDWGIGMTEQQLENAVKAGFSSKNTASNLGLFGMGFNVATSRLANTVQVWTATADMQNEVGVCIDLREMKRTGSFHRPKMEKEKRADKISGTRIEIYDYKPEATNLLQPKQIARELNRAYSERIFNEYNIRILVNNEEVKPFKFCIWGKNRTVKHKYDEVPAYIEIDEHLAEELFCESCFSWLGDIVDTPIEIQCPHCQTTGRIIKKDIYITGWVGIQRYSDSDHYGIDISRNGRILSKLDKSFFSWDNENGKDDTRFNPEYPRDTTYAGGRIVGQLEANFVIPKYTKDDFEKDDTNWKRVVNFIRGEMPLQPDLASSFGYKQPNRSPIGRLFNAYRKINQPGSKTLVFAKDDGSCDHVTSRNWANYFYEGNPDYQDDTKWWEAVIRADLKTTTSTFNPLNPGGKSPGTPTSSSEKPQAPPEKFPGKKFFTKKPKHFDIEKLIGEKPMDLTLIDYYPENDINIPIIFESQGTIMKFYVYLNYNHLMFRDFADGFEDLIFMEAASIYHNIVTNKSEWTLTRIYYELKSKYAGETMLSVSNLDAKAKKLMRDIQNELVSGSGILLSRKPNLSESEVKTIKSKYLEQEKKPINNIEELLKTTKYLNYLEIQYLFKFIKEFPEIIFDNKILNLPYLEIEDSELRQEELNKYIGYFNDVKWFITVLANQSDEAIKKMKQPILRNRISIEILDGSINK